MGIFALIGDELYDDIVSGTAPNFRTSGPVQGTQIIIGHYHTV